MVRAHRSLDSVINDRFATVFSLEDEAIAALGGTLALAGEPLIPWPRRYWLGGIDAILTKIGDQFVTAKLNERTQGADLMGLQLRWVGPAPIMAAVPAWLDETASQKLVAHANGSLTDGVTAIRRALAELTWNAEPLSYLTATASESGFSKGLIHTSYFAVAEVCEIIRKALEGKKPGPKCVRAVAPPKFRTGTFSAIPLFSAYAIAASSVALVPYGLAAPYLQSLIPQQVVRDAVDQAPVPSASWEIGQDPPEAVRIVGRLAEMDQIEKFASKLDQSNSPLRLYSELALGLTDRQRPDLARGYLETARRYTQGEDVAEIKTIGPSLAVSRHMKAYARALARLGLSAQLDDLVVRTTARIDDDAASRRAADELAAEATVGFAASGDHDAARREFDRIFDEYIKRDAVSAAIEHSSDARFIEALIAQLRAEDLRQDLTAELIASRHLTSAIADLSRLIGSIDRAAPRTIATSALAKRLGREGRASEGVALIEADLLAFNSRQRKPIEGLRIHYVRYAEALVALGDPNRARTLLRIAEALPLEKEGDTTYSDFSGPDRALLWARLGEVEKAIALARDNADTRESLFGDIGRLLTRVVDEEALKKASATVTDPLGRTRLIVGSLTGNPSSTLHRQALRELVEQAQLVTDPRIKSALLAEIAKGWIRAGSFRRALEIGATTRSHDFLDVIAEMVSRFYDSQGSTLAE